MFFLGTFCEKKGFEQGTTGKDFGHIPLDLQLQIPFGQLWGCSPQGEAGRQEGLQPLDVK